MTIECLQISKIDGFFKIFIQVVLIFIFLTIFFFTYVNKIEKDSFKLQMDILVDDMFKNLDGTNIVPEANKQDVLNILNKTLDKQKTKVIEESKDSDDKINNSNKQITNNAFILVGVVCGVLSVTILITYLIGYCIPVHIHLRDAILSVFFVAMIELIFLSLVTKNYISIYPNSIKYKIGDSIQQYIINKKLKK